MLEKLAVLDWIILAIILVSTLISLKRGFFKEAFSLVTWIVALIVSFLFADALATYLHAISDSPSIRKLSAMAILFITTLIAGGLLRFLIEQLIHFTGLTGTDRVLGMVFGALRGLLIVVMLSMAGKKMLPLEEESWWKASVLQPHLAKVEAWAAEKASQIKHELLPMIRQLDYQ